jgi:hypothetical protein
VIREPALTLTWQDDVLVMKLRCPACGTFEEVDHDQYVGKVSLDCSICPFHETHDLRDAPLFVDHRGPTHSAGGPV